MKNSEIQPKDIWSNSKREKIDALVKKHKSEQSKEQKIRAELLGIKYKLEDYIENDDLKESQILNILDFVKMYLKVLDITKKDLANYFNMRDSNLHKYLTGQRKLNPEVVLKISSFSNTKPEYWYRIQIKNELAKLKKEDIEDYEKYDYKRMLALR
jgi:antitoxin HigA-1